MVEIKSFTFNPFQENTHLLYNDKKEAIIIDPGAYFEKEQHILLDFIERNELQPLRLLNTHCHLDHIFSNNLIAKKFHLSPEIHKKEEYILTNSFAVGMQYNLPFEASPQPKSFLNEQDKLFLGDDELSILFTPGHSPGSICFYCKKQNFLIGGDVLFRESIGRTDLPGGNHEVLLQSIREKLFPLPDNTIVYSGHGPTTTIGHEKTHNPFIQ